MARSKTVTGIDIGSAFVKVLVADSSIPGPPRIIGAGSAESTGVRDGYIINIPEITLSIKKAVQEAESESGNKIKTAYISIGGIGLGQLQGKGETTIARADGVVVESDVETALASAELSISKDLLNKKILHAIPISYSINGNKVLGRPLGMRGATLNAQTLFITAIEQHVNDAIGAVESLGIEVVDVMASPVASGLVSLSKSQKVAGCALLDIGANTTSLIIFEDNTPVSITVFQIGGAQITNDVALEFRISLTEAEQIKRGALSPDISQKKVQDISTIKYREIFSRVHSHLKSIKKDGLLPAGIILTGGASSFLESVNLARTILKIPSARVTPKFGERAFKDASWSVAYGLCFWGASDDSGTIGIESARETSMKIMRWFKKFLP